MIHACINAITLSIDPSAFISPWLESPLQNYRCALQSHSSLDPSAETGGEGKDRHGRAKLLGHLSRTLQPRSRGWRAPLHLIWIRSKFGIRSSGTRLVPAAFHSAGLVCMENAGCASDVSYLDVDGHGELTRLYLCPSACFQLLCFADFIIDSPHLPSGMRGVQCTRLTETAVRDGRLRSEDTRDVQHVSDWQLFRPVLTLDPGKSEVCGCATCNAQGPR